MKINFSNKHLKESKSYSHRLFSELRKQKSVKVLNFKEPKFPFETRKTEKSFLGKKPKFLTSSRMLPAPTINSNSEEKFPKMTSIRTFSPSVEKISFKLNEKRREKTNIRKQEVIIERLENVLEEYQN